MSTTKLTVDQQTAVIYWPSIAKIPIIPCITYPEKQVSLKNWSKTDFTKIDFDTQLAAGLYDNGTALLLGRTLNNGALGAEQGYSFALDFDGWDAVEKWFGSWERVVQISKKTRIEWHGGNKGRIHMIFLSSRPIANKRIIISQGSQIEIRCENELLFASPSIHPDGTPWVPLGTNEIAILDDNQLLNLESKIDGLCEGYMSDDSKQRYIQWLEDSNTIIEEGAGRHPALVILGTSYFYRYVNGWKDLTDDQRKSKLQEWHIQHCRPPKTERELDEIWKWIIDTHRRRRDEERQKYDDERRRHDEEIRKGSPNMSDGKRGMLCNLLQAYGFSIPSGDILTMISENPPKFIIARKRDGYICRMSVTFSDSGNKNSATKKAHMNYGAIIFRLFPKKVTLHESPLKFLDSAPQYTIVFEDQSHKEFAVTGSIATIVSILKEKPGYVVSSYGVTEALTAIIGAFSDDGRLEVDESVSFEGYYYHDNDIKISRIDFDKKHPIRTIEECKQCINYLEERAKFQIWDYKGRTIDRRDLLASIIKWAIAAPFNFAMKQQNCKPYLKGFNMSGERDGGKTGLSTEILNMHGNPTNEQDADSIYSVSAGSLNTEAKFGKAVSRTTYEVEFSEFGNIESFGRHEDLVDIYKTMIDGLICRRGRDVVSGKYDAPFPSCSPPIINGNPVFSRRGEVVKRSHINKFSEEDRHDRDPKSPFNIFYNQNGHLLKILGDWTMRYIYVENRRELLLSKKYNPYEVGQIALERFYEHANGPGAKVPEWLTMWITDTALEELDQDDESIIRSILYNHVHKTLRDNYTIMKTFTSPNSGIEDIGKVTLEQRISLCLEAQFWPWIRKIRNYGEKSQDIIKYNIDTSIMEIFSYRLPTLTFKKLSEKTGFEYIKDGSGRAKLLCGKKEFVDFIDSKEEEEGSKTVSSKQILI